jgi:hypothetical protein
MKMPSWVDGMEEAIRAKGDKIPRGYVSAKEYAENRGITAKAANKRLRKAMKLGLVVKINLLITKLRSDGKAAMCPFYGPPIEKNK